MISHGEASSTFCLLCTSAGVTLQNDGGGRSGENILSSDFPSKIKK